MGMRMRKIALITIFLLCSSTGRTEEFSIAKVNHIEKMWVIPLDRRSFIGSRGIQKFDYARPVDSKNQGEYYVIKWRYKGREVKKPIILKFEYKTSLPLLANSPTAGKPKELFIRKKAYLDLKRGNFKWTFKNVGSIFAEEGKVDRWKVSLVFDGKIVAEKRSATWRAMEGT